MITTIQNDKIKISVNAFGAELVSLVTLHDDTEMLWQADENFWSSHSPILFPFVGRLENERYEYEGKAYHMQIHGFAKNKVFAIYTTKPNEIVYKLTYDDDTLKQYPFRFELFKTFEINDNKLEVKFDVINLDSKAMYFSLGGHPGFNCPLYENETMDDYYVEFEKKEDLKIWRKQGLKITNEPVDVMENENRINLSHSLFYDDAMIFKALKSNWIKIKNIKNDKQIAVNFSDFPYLGIWSASKGAPFVCIEPWHGIGFTQNDSQDIKKKDGILCLNTKSSFQCKYYISLI